MYLEEIDIIVGERKDMGEYGEYYIACIDLLGFSNRISECSFDSIYNIFEMLEKSKLVDIIKNGEHLIDYKSIKYYIILCQILYAYT